MGFLIPMILFALFCTWGIISSITAGFSNLFTDIFTLAGFGVGFLVSGYWVYDILSGYQLIRKGVVLASQRIQEEKDNRNKTYQYVFDIYLEDSDQSLMSYQVDKEVFSSIEPGDGVVLHAAEAVQELQRARAVLVWRGAGHAAQDKRCGLVEFEVRHLPTGVRQQRMGTGLQLGPG